MQSKYFFTLSYISSAFLDTLMVLFFNFHSAETENSVTKYCANICYTIENYTFIENAKIYS